ncbi:MAG: hypothetical protein PW792_03470 [Acidobacteriaceae bacterium]|nr:hypothetical protein [Acidobacteriaceae bacterium]
MSITRRSHLFLITLLCHVLLFSQTAHAANRAAVAASLTQAPQQVVKLTVAPPQQRRTDARAATVALPDLPIAAPLQSIAWTLVLAALLLIAAETKQRYTSSSLASLAVLPQRARFSRRE